MAAEENATTEATKEAPPMNEDDAYLAKADLEIILLGDSAVGKSKYVL